MPLPAPFHASRFVWAPGLAPGRLPVAVLPLESCPW